MRLLAHGGTSYTERRRVGAWPSIPRDALEDTYGLPGASRIYGLGVLEDCQPFLIYRLRQVTDSGRSYAFSLLLDPGGEVWERFGWNCADLLRALLADGIGAALVTQPESLSVEEVSAGLARLAPLAATDANDGAGLRDEHGPAPESSTESVPVIRRASAQEGEVAGAAAASQGRLDLLDCWIGAAFSGETVAAAPSAFGFASRPAHEELAQLLGRLPRPCFRAGSGWLVGGSREHGHALGARFVLDDGCDPASVASSAAAALGHRISDAWSLVVGDPELGPSVARLGGLPPCRWEGVGAQGVAAAGRRLLLVAEMLDRARPSEQLIAEFERDGAATPFLAAQARRATHRLALSAPGRTLSPAETALVLRNYYEHGLAIAVEDVRRLDPQTRVGEVVKHESLATPGRAPLPLPREVRAEVFIRMLEAAEEVRLPWILTRAAEFVADSYEAGTEREAREAELVEAVSRRMQARGDPLYIWQDFPRDNQLGQRLVAALREEARRRALAGRAGWELEYLRYGSDPGGDYLHIKGVSPDQVSRLIRRCLEEVGAGSDLSAPALAWLDALAYSSLREKASIKDKVAVAQSRVSKRWMPFLALWAGYRDLPNADELIDDTVFPSGPRAQDERAALRCELNQMLDEQPPGQSAPDLRAIQLLLVRVPGDFLQLLIRQHHPRVDTTRALAQWVEGLRAVGEDEAAAKETVDFCLNTTAPLPDEWLFRGFDEAQLERLALQLLFVGFRYDDDSRRRRCEEVLASRLHLPRLRRVFEQAYKIGIKDQLQLENFVRRYAGHEAALDRIFACLPKALRAGAVNHLVDPAYTEVDFVKEAQRILNAVNAGESVTPYRRAVLEYARRDERLLKKIAGWFGASSDLDDDIGQILSRPAEEDSDGETAATARIVVEIPPRRDAERVERRAEQRPGPHSSSPDESRVESHAEPLESSRGADAADGNDARGGKSRTRPSGEGDESPAPAARKGWLGRFKDRVGNLIYQEQPAGEGGGRVEEGERVDAHESARGEDGAAVRGGADSSASVAAREEE